MDIELPALGRRYLDAYDVEGLNEMLVEVEHSARAETSYVQKATHLTDNLYQSLSPSTRTAL